MVTAFTTYKHATLGDHVMLWKLRNCKQALINFKNYLKAQDNWIEDGGNRKSFQKFIAEDELQQVSRINTADKQLRQEFIRNMNSGQTLVY